MVKSELREAGYAEETKHQKSTVITLIWVFSALAMIVSVFVFTIVSGMLKNSGNDFVDFLDDLALMLLRVFQEWNFAVYLLIWVFIFLTLYFVTRGDLREQKQLAKAPRFGKYMLRIALVLLFLAAFCYLLIAISEMPGSIPEQDSESGGWEAGGFDFFFLVVFWEYLYLATKFITTLFVCQNKKNGTKIKILKGNAMPVCSSQEAFSLWHILVSYLIPFVFMYSLLLGLCASANDGAFLVNHTIAAVFMSIFLAYDLTLVLYAVYMKIRHRMDYISIDHHFYEVTLFTKSYVKTIK